MAIGKQFSEKVIMYDKAGQLSLKTLGTQIFPKSPNLLLEAMAFLVRRSKEKSKYLVLDLNPQSELTEAYMLRSSIFPDADNGKK